VPALAHVAATSRPRRALLSDPSFIPPLLSQRFDMKRGGPGLIDPLPQAGILHE